MQTISYKRQFSFWLEFIFPFLATIFITILSWLLNWGWPKERAIYLNIMECTISISSILAGLIGVVLALFPMLIHTKLFKDFKKYNNHTIIIIYLAVSILINVALIISGVIGYFVILNFLYWIALFSLGFVYFLMLIILMIALIMDFTKTTPL